MCNTSGTTSKASRGLRDMKNNTSLPSKPLPVRLGYGSTERVAFGRASSVSAAFQCQCPTFHQSKHHIDSYIQTSYGCRWSKAFTCMS